MAEKEEELKSLLLMKVKEEGEKVDLKLNIQKTRSWHLVPYFTANGKDDRLYFWGAPKSLQMMTAAMKLKDAWSLEEKLWPT